MSRSLSRLSPLHLLCVFTFACLVVVCHAIAVAQEKYSDYDDAMIAAARFLRKNDYPSAVPPLEAALTLAKDDAQRLKVYQALVPAYRQQPEIDKLLTAQEFIIRHTDRKAGRSLAARDVTSFAYQRGKLDAVTERYDAQFAQDPKDPAALTILNSIYSQTKRNDRRTPLLKQELDALDRELAATFAQGLENEAQTAPKTTAWLLKDAAAAWLEAGDNPKALASAKKSAAAAPEARTTQLTHMWHEGLGDVFLKAGEPQLAVAQFEAAIAVAPYDSAREAVQKKLAEARGTAVSK